MRKSADYWKSSNLQKAIRLREIYHLSLFSTVKANIKPSGHPFGPKSHNMLTKLTTVNTKQCRSTSIIME